MSRPCIPSVMPPSGHPRRVDILDVGETVEVTNHADALRARIRAIPVSLPPAPWSTLPTIAVGGLTEVGVATVDGADLTMTVSGAGRAVFDGQGNPLARDRDEPSDLWLDEVALEVAGIGPLHNERVRIAGLSGGGLPVATRDGWRVMRIALDWPDELVILQPPGCGALRPGREEGCVTIFDHDASELRAFGFSPSGRTLILGTSSDLRLHTRAH